MRWQLLRGSDRQQRLPPHFFWTVGEIASPHEKRVHASLFTFGFFSALFVANIELSSPNFLHFFTFFRNFLIFFEYRRNYSMLIFLRFFPRIDV
jgi:hypothetical protein